MKKGSLFFEKEFYEGLRKNEPIEVNLKDVEKWYFGSYLVSGNIRSFRNRLALNFLKREISDKKILLEYGCGNGDLSLFFSQFHKKVFGFDLSEVSANVALRKRDFLKDNDGLDLDVEFFCGNASKLGIKNESVDIVFGHGILHHIKKYDGVGDELYRVLKRGGVAIFAENLGENKLLERIRRRNWKRKGLGGIEDTLKYRDIREIGKEFQKVKIIELSLFSTVKRIFGYKNPFFIRPFIFLFFWFDFILLKIFPFLRKYSAESVIIFKKG